MSEHSNDATSHLLAKQVEESLALRSLILEEIRSTRETVNVLDKRIAVVANNQDRLIARDNNVDSRLLEVEKDLVKIKTYGTLLVLLMSTIGPMIAKVIFKL